MANHKRKSACGSFMNPKNLLKCIGAACLFLSGYSWLNKYLADSKTREIQVELWKPLTAKGSLSLKPFLPSQSSLVIDGFCDFHEPGSSVFEKFKASAEEIDTVESALIALNQEDREQREIIAENCIKKHGSAALLPREFLVFKRIKSEDEGSDFIIDPPPAVPTYSRAGEVFIIFGKNQEYADAGQRKRSLSY